MPVHRLSERDLKTSLMTRSAEDVIGNRLIETDRSTAMLAVRDKEVGSRTFTLRIGKVDKQSIDYTITFAHLAVISHREAAFESLKRQDIAVGLKNSANEPVISWAVVVWPQVGQLLLQKYRNYVFASGPGKEAIEYLKGDSARLMELKVQVYDTVFDFLNTNYNLKLWGVSLLQDTKISRR